MDKAVQFDQTQTSESAGYVTSAPRPAGAAGNPRPFVPVTHEQLLRAAIVAARNAASSAADLRRTFDAERSARAASRGQPQPT
jgi:hypothetical protein